MALPDSGNPADYTPEQIEELLATDKTALTKSQKAALARYNFQKAKAEQAAKTGELQAGGVPAPAAPQAPAPQAGGPPAKAAAPKPSPDEEARKKHEERLAREREEASKFAYAVRLREKFPDQVVDLVMQRDKPCLVVKPAAVADVLAAARSNGFDHLQCLTAADHPPGRIDVVYNLLSYGTKEHLAVKSPLNRDAPRVASVSGLWGGAVWLEREVWDMFGVRFEGLADHRRLLLPEGWTGHPLRKDYDSTREQFIAMADDGEDVVSFEEAKGW